jgi:Integrase zinc binding domain
VERGRPSLEKGGYFSHFSTDPVNPGAQALAVDDLPREISLEELRYEKQRDPEISELFGTGGSGRNPVIDVNRDGIAIRKAPLDGAEQILVPLALRPHVLYLEHHPKSVGHPGVTKMFRSMRKRYFWRNMYREVEDTVRGCEHYARNNVQERTRVNHMKIVPANEPLEFIEIDILGPLPETAHGNRFASDLGSLLEVDSDCTYEDEYDTGCRERILRSLGFRVWPAKIPTQ